MEAPMLRKGLFCLVFVLIGMTVGWFLHDQWPITWAQSPLATAPNAPFTQTGGLPPTGAPSPALNLGLQANGAATVDPLADLTPEELVNVRVYEQRNLGVVYISTKSIRPDSFLMVSAVEGSGSGSVIDKQGHILTNHHVIEGARDINVTLFNGEAYAAELVGQDPENDVAILRINAPEQQLYPIPMGDSSNLRVGQRVLAIGNPFGLERTMTDGIISSLNRQLPSRNRRTMKSIIQIDAALNQGNSGGPLLNTKGELIGMNTAIATNTGDNTGIGFSIPVNTIKRLAPQLIQSGRVTRPTIGITRVYETEEGIGVLVVNVTPGGPAEKAGVQGFKLVRKQVKRAGFVFDQEVVDNSSADLIIGIDGTRIAKADDITTIIENKKEGDQVVLTVVRKGKQLNIPVTLGSSE